LFFFDLFDMELNLKATMLNNINDSDFVIIICTPRYKERVKMGSSNNARYELDTIMEKKRKLSQLFMKVIFLNRFQTNLKPI